MYITLTTCVTCKCCCVTEKKKLMYIPKIRHISANVIRLTSELLAISLYFADFRRSASSESATDNINHSIISYLTFFKTKQCKITGSDTRQLNLSNYLKTLQPSSSYLKNSSLAAIKYVKCISCISRFAVSPFTLTRAC